MYKKTKLISASLFTLSGEKALGDPENEYYGYFLRFEFFLPPKIFKARDTVHRPSRSPKKNLLEGRHVLYFGEILSFKDNIEF